MTTADDLEAAWGGSRVMSDDGEDRISIGTRDDLVRRLPSEEPDATRHLYKEGPQDRARASTGSSSNRTDSLCRARTSRHDRATLTFFTHAASGNAATM